MDEVENFQYSISLPVDCVFDTIDDHVDLAEVVGQPILQAQKTMQAYILFQATRKLKSYLKPWNRMVAVDQTWPNTNIHFCTALQDIRSVNNTPVNESSDHADMIQEVPGGV